MRSFLTQHWKYLTDVAGTLFSLAGLIVSIFAAIYASRAKTLAGDAAQAASDAARSARHIAQTRTLHEYLTDCSRVANDISKYVDLEHREMALQSARETLRLALFVTARWEPELTVPTMNRLVAAKTQLESIIKVLLKGPIAELGTGHKNTLRMAAQRVSNLFIEELGLATRMREGIEDNG